jgi:MFS family permease
MEPDIIKEMAKTKINKVVKIMIQADLIFVSAFGLITPIFAVFILNQIKGGDVRVIGFAAAIYWILKSLLQVPIGKYLDKNIGEKDDFYFVVIGYFLAVLVPLGYIFSSLPWHVYGLQALYAVGMGMAIPGWAAIFTRHIDKGKEAFEWSLESTAMGLGAGITGAIGGILASKFGFNIVFILVAAGAFTGSLLLLTIYKGIFSRGDHHLIIPKSGKPPLP